MDHMFDQEIIQVNVINFIGEKFMRYTYKLLKLWVLNWQRKLNMKAKVKPNWFCRIFAHGYKLQAIPCVPLQTVPRIQRLWPLHIQLLATTSSPDQNLPINHNINLKIYSIILHSYLLLIFFLLTNLLPSFVNFSKEKIYFSFAYSQKFIHDCEINKT
jgi:hypothetical protein